MKHKWKQQRRMKMRDGIVIKDNISSAARTNTGQETKEGHPPKCWTNSCAETRDAIQQQARKHEQPSTEFIAKNHAENAANKHALRK